MDAPKGQGARGWLLELHLKHKLTVLIAAWNSDPASDFPLLAFRQIEMNWCELEGLDNIAPVVYFTT